MPGTSLHVTLVDDNARLLSLLQRALERSGYTVHTCHDGLEAWNWLSEHPSEILVTDLNMPEMGGQELITKIRESQRDMGILVLTGYLSPEHDEQLLSLGVDRILIKPDDVKELRRHIGEVSQARGFSLPELSETQVMLPVRAVPEDNLPTVMLLEDDPTWSRVMERALGLSLADVHIITCSSLHQAGRLAEVTRIDVLLSDIYLPDGLGMEFICDLLSVQPRAKVVVVTASHVPGFRQRSREIGVVRFLEKPVLPEEVVRLVRQLLPETGRENQPQLPQTRFTPADMVQLKCLGQASGVLRFYSPAYGTGSIFLEKGEILDALCGDKAGRDGFREILTWRNVELMELPLEEDRPATILPRDGQALLREAVEQQAAETSAQ